ncbi:MAG: hypothetical protein M1840_005298 [Geoglossum simile]|nr:MAG: hypothetical protein M1840_005298 [Geoglossum simile]
MVQTRRQSQLGDGEGVRITVDSETTEHTSTSYEGATTGTDNLATVSRKRRKITATKNYIGLSETVVEMGDTITVLPGLPLRSKDSGEAIDSRTTVSTIPKALEPQETKFELGEPSKPTHTRFASEEPEPQMVLASVVPPENPPKPAVQDPEDDESEDDAPEAITLLSGQDQVKSREEEAAKALKRQSADARKKRKERDAKLKEQAASKRNKKRKLCELEEDETTPAAPVRATSTAPQYRLSRSNLPALLPEEILLAVPTTRPPTPPPQQKSQKNHQSLRKHKIFTEKPPKDVKRGPITIRVLEPANKVLAPKVVKASSSIKQSWLAGRPGRNGHPSVERRKIGGGFLRR